MTAACMTKHLKLNLSMGDKSQKGKLRLTWLCMMKDTEVYLTLQTVKAHV